MTRAMPVVACLVLLAGCTEEPRRLEPAAAAAPVADTRPVLRFGVISRYNPVLMYRLYQPLVDYLSARTPYRVELVLGKTYRDAVRFLGEGRTDIAYLGGVTYLMARVQFGARPLAKPLNPDGEATYRPLPGPGLGVLDGRQPRAPPRTGRGRSRPERPGALRPPAA